MPTTPPAPPSGTPELPPQAQLFRLATGFYVSNAIYVAAKLGIADHIAAGKRTAVELAQATSTHAPSLRRVLRLLASAGIFTEEPKTGAFSLTALGECLRDNVPGSMRHGALLFGGITQAAWNDLLYSVATGKPAFEHIHKADPFTYFAAHPDQAVIFDKAMADFTSQISAAVAKAYNFSKFGTVVDVGGGNGTLLIAILKAYPGVHGVLYDQPQAVAAAGENFRAAAMLKRCRLVGGNFFDKVPKGGDAYLLKHVIHDWDDDQAATILKNCHRAMKSEGKLIIIEGVYPPHIDNSDFSRASASNDVNMLVCTGGRQRSEDEFRALFVASGFDLSRVIPAGPRASLIIANPA
jgi:SAM-dependent methyltransferase